MPKFTIVMFPRIQDDTAVAYFLLKNFGQEKFPGIENAAVEFWTEMPEDKTTEELEQEGYILVDFGNSRFDHHKLGPENKTKCASTLVAEFLGVDDRIELHKLLEFARRSDLEGKGTLSKDAIDRAFGLAGLLTCLNKVGKFTPQKILDMVQPLLEAHYLHECLKYKELPKEYEEGLQKGTIKQFNAMQLGRQLKVLFVHSDNTTLAGFLRSKAVGADMVIQKSSAGHVNFITRQAAQIKLHKLARQIKLLEAQKHGITLNIDSLEDLEKPGRTEGLAQWYYDGRANTLQNGGVNPQDIPPTSLTNEEIEIITKQSLNISRQEQPPRNHGYGRNGFKREGFRRSHGAIIIE